MKNRYLLIVSIVVAFTLSAPLQAPCTADLTLDKTPVQVYFSPKGGCTDAIISEIDQAKTEILVQAYSFTSAPIAKALVDAHKRGVKVTVVLDRSQRSDMFSTNQTCRNRPPCGLLPGPGGFPKKGSGVPFGELGWRVGEQEL